MTHDDPASTAVLQILNAVEEIDAIHKRAVNDVAKRLIVGDPVNADYLARVWARDQDFDRTQILREARQQAEPFMSKAAIDSANLYDRMLQPKDAISWTPTA
jgi:hypothetical protein